MIDTPSSEVISQLLPVCQGLYVCPFRVSVLEHTSETTRLNFIAKRLAGKCVSDMTYLVSSGTLNLNSINQV